MTGEAGERAESAARSSHGRLLALLAARTHDLAGAQDALADAFERALTRWPVDGVPDDPDAWLLTVARNRQRDRWRSAAHRTSVLLDPDQHEVVDAQPEARDRRLDLLLLCAHPDIAPAARVPLMLNTVLGYPAERIGLAFLIPPTTMAGRLVRAKQRIRRDRIPFEPPDDAAPERAAAVLEAVYGAYGIEWPTVPRDRHALILGLAEVVTEAMPRVAEAHGLAALLCLSSARLPARLDDAGRFVPLADQDPARWDEHLIVLGHRHLRAAHGLSAVGPFQLEAAINAVHCARVAGAPPDWATLRRLHESLQVLAPTAGGRVALAAVIAETDGAAAGLACLDTVDATARLQPAWVLRAHLLRRIGDSAGADAALRRAIDLTTDPAERAHLGRRR
ncbi:RNA polymerase sigma factor [[Mycobacterium] crassicus]|uniref:DUF6596 domain-containing protein n=1 Tax=[Mycobacterium] crassicus TaxID=2872309 RepID=A0ABU5XK99_9MYCO|nr:DUF6596 domain-containing protein [Mycolicibacter sp. MYC098]MEB3022700.1 DUF6596 domain-containing protein [Mycolicibacter sp. MYC098]